MSHAPDLQAVRAPSDERRFDDSPRYDAASGLTLHVSPLSDRPSGVLARALLDEGRPLEPLADAWLRPAERLWWDGVPDRRQADALLGTIALREALLPAGRSDSGEAAETPTILHRPGSAPRVSGEPGVHCSVSHDCAAAVAVVSPDPIGVDIVGTDRFDHSVLERIAAPEEADAARAAGVNASEVASLLWAAKEAVLKGVGLGLGLHPRRVVIGPGRDASLRAELPPLFDTPRHWRVDLERWEGRWLAVARPEMEPEP